MAQKAEVSICGAWASNIFPRHILIGNFRNESKERRRTSAMTRLDEQKKKGENDNQRDSVSLTEAFPDPTIILLINKKKRREQQQ